MISLWNAQDQKCNVVVASCQSALDPTISLYSGLVSYKEPLQILQILLTTAQGIVPRPSYCSEGCSIVAVHSNVSDQQGQKSTPSSLSQKKGVCCKDIGVSKIIFGQEKHVVSKRLESGTILTTRLKSSSLSLKPHVSSSLLFSKFCFPLLSILQMEFSVLMAKDG